MESRTAEVPFNADWEALLRVASMPARLFSTFPYRVEVRGEGKPVVSISFKKLLTKFQFEGTLEFTFNEPHATYIIKGIDGLLVFSFSALNSRLVARVSGDIPGERRLGKKLSLLAEGSALAVARMTESYRAVSKRLIGSPEDFTLQNLTPSLLPHILRYARLHTGRKSFEVIGEGNGGKFTISVRDDFVGKMEHDSGFGVSITHIEKGILDVGEEDFRGVELEGKFRIRVVYL